MRYLAAIAFLAAGTACAADLTPMKDAGPYVPSPQSVVSDMLREAGVNDQDFLIDLGSGDGRIVRTAVKIFGARGFGVEIKEDLVRQANEAAAKDGIAERVKFIKADLFKTDISQATIVTMYLLPDTVNMLKDKFLAELKPGTRIVSHDGGIGDWPADETLRMKTPEKPVGIGGDSKIELWVVPAQAAGTWTSDLGAHGGTWQFRIGQRYQALDVSAAAGGRDLLVRNTRLRGEEIKMVITGLVGTRPWHHYFVGRLRGERIDGQVSISDGNNTRTMPWVASRAK
jgi:hypothetical protein